MSRAHREHNRRMRILHGNIQFLVSNITALSGKVPRVLELTNSGVQLLTETRHDELVCGIADTEAVVFGRAIGAAFEFVIGPCPPKSGSCGVALCAGPAAAGRIQRINAPSDSQAQHWERLGRLALFQIIFFCIAATSFGLWRVQLFFLCGLWPAAPSELGELSLDGGRRVGCTSCSGSSIYCWRFQLDDRGI